MTTIFHNPRCSKSREALALLEEKNITTTTRLYLVDVLSEDEIKTLLSQLDITPIELMRTKETLYKELGLNKAETTDSQRIQAMSNHPKLIERPIVVHNNQAKIGRPPENILSLFQ